jgi:hypothetical protein
MINQQYNEEYLFFHTVETFYDQESNLISNEDFKCRLSNNEKVSVEKTEIKLLYNQDKTKLRLVIYNQNKRFVQLKNSKLKRVVPKKQKLHTGFTIDLNNNNVYTYIIVHNLKRKNKSKTIRCNSFFNILFNTLDTMTRYRFNQNHELVDILCKHLHLKPDYYSTASEILSAYYLRSRNIEYYAVDNLKHFMGLFLSNRKKYSNTDIYRITQDTLRIKDINYVKLFYEQKQCNSMFYYMVLFDLFKMNPVEITKKNNFFDVEQRIPYNYIERIRFFYNKFNDIYFFRYDDFRHHSEVCNNLQIINQFYGYGFKINVEKLTTINKIRHILGIIMYYMVVSICEDGYVLHNPKSIDVISKHMGDNYSVNYQMVPKEYANLLIDKKISETNVFAFHLTEYIIERSDGAMRTIFLDQNNQQIFYVKNGYIHVGHTPSKFGKLLNKYNKNFEEYYNIFSSTSCFYDERFVTLCKEDEDKINAYKYISKI